MPRSSFQKLKIIYIMEYLLKNSDENHAVTTSQIIAYLKSLIILLRRERRSIVILKLCGILAWTSFRYPRGTITATM